MSNSPLVDYTLISPHKNSPRNNRIDTITPHMVVGQTSVESLGHWFYSGTRASSNYGVGFNGKIGLYVDEKDRAWTTSSALNDNRAITIEVASDTRFPYAVNKVAYLSLVDLLADICKRNGIQSLKWRKDPNLIGQTDKQNMTAHFWFSGYKDSKTGLWVPGTNCPGDYLFRRFGDIANRVNKKLGTYYPNVVEATLDDTETLPITFEEFTKQTTDIITSVYQSGGSYRVKTSRPQGGYYIPPVKEEEKDKPQPQQPKASKQELEVGEIIELKENAKYINGKTVPSWLTSGKYPLYIREVRGDDIVFSTLKKGPITGVVNSSHIVEKFEPYVVRVTVDALNVRKGPGVQYGINTVIKDKGAYTIVEEEDNWGKLKSGAGWISLVYTKRV